MLKRLASLPMTVFVPVFLGLCVGDLLWGGVDRVWEWLPERMAISVGLMLALWFRSVARSAGTLACQDRTLF